MKRFQFTLLTTSTESMSQHPIIYLKLTTPALRMDLSHVCFKHSVLPKTITTDSMNLTLVTSHMPQRNKKPRSSQDRTSSGTQVTSTLLSMILTKTISDAKRSTRKVLSGLSIMQIARPSPDTTHMVRRW
jgi:hypothetical protein